MSEVKEPIPCRWCGEVHGPGEHCPLVKALNFDPASGKVTRVEFLTPADFGSPVNAPLAADHSGETGYPTLKPTGRI